MKLFPWSREILSLQIDRRNLCEQSLSLEKHDRIVRSPGFGRILCSFCHGAGLVWSSFVLQKFSLLLFGLLLFVRSTVCFCSSKFWLSGTLWHRILSIRWIVQMYFFQNLIENSFFLSKIHFGKSSTEFLNISLIRFKILTSWNNNGTIMLNL